MVLVVMVVMMLMFIVIVIIVVIVIMVVMMLLLFLMLQFIAAFLNLMDPGGACGNFLKVKHICIENNLQLYVTVIALQYAGAGLQGTNHLAYAQQLLGTYLGCLVEQNYVAELNLLDDQVLQVLLADILLNQVIAATELVTDTQGIDHCYNAVQLRYAVLGVLGFHTGD